VSDPDEVFTVRLEAEPRTLVERITEREPAAWSGLTELLEHTQELAVTMPALALVDLVLSTEDERPEDVAAFIRAACPTQLTAPAPPSGNAPSGRSRRRPSRTSKTRSRPPWIGAGT
jgi:hypothetical protein